MLAVKTPASLRAFRQQAEKVFNDNISSSLFQSPSMARLKRQTDDLFASVSSTISSVVPTSVTSFFSSWWS